MFFNTANKNILIKQASKLLIDYVPVNQKLYVPMIAKLFDLSESE